MPLTELSQISSSNDCLELGDTYKKPITQTETFYPAVLSEDKGKPMRLSAPCRFIRTTQPGSAVALGFSFRPLSPLGQHKQGTVGAQSPDPRRGQVRKRPCWRYAAITLLKRSKQKAFMLFYIYVVLSIGPGVRWSPSRRSPCLPFGRLSWRAGTHAALSPGQAHSGQVPFSFHAESHTSTGQSALREGGSAPASQHHTEVSSDNIWAVSLTELKNKEKPEQMDEVWASPTTWIPLLQTPCDSLWHRRLLADTHPALLYRALWPHWYPRWKRALFLSATQTQRGHKILAHVESMGTVSCWRCSQVKNSRQSQTLQGYHTGIHHSHETKTMISRANPKPDA